MSDMENLRVAVTDMDALSQECLSKMSAVAALAASAIDGYKVSKTGRDWTMLDNLRETFQLIEREAGTLMNDINVRAEQVGCNYKENAAA